MVSLEGPSLNSWGDIFLTIIPQIGFLSVFKRKAIF